MTQQTELSPMRQAMAELTAANELAGPDPVRLGVLSPMTPPGDAMAGVIVARGARLGADYLRENGGVLGGRGISFVGANDMATADREGFHRSAIGAMANLALVDDVLAVFGQWHLRTAKWVVELCERLGVPMFVENGLSSATHGRRTIFRTYFSIEDRVPLMIDALAHIGARRIGLLTSDTVFAGDTADSAKAGGTVIASGLHLAGCSQKGRPRALVGAIEQNADDWAYDLDQPHVTAKTCGGDSRMDAGCGDGRLRRAQATIQFEEEQRARQLAGAVAFGLDVALVGVEVVPVDPGLRPPRWRLLAAE